jgi:predicted transcriptional regulator
MATEEVPTKNMTLRLDKELADRVQAIAEVEGQSVTTVVRTAIADHVEQRRRDPKFQHLLAESLERHSKLLELLADG